MSSEVNQVRPTRYFSLHFRMLRFLGLGWWHQPDENDYTNFPVWYIPYSIITQLIWVVGFVGLETIDPFIGHKEMERFMFSLSFVITHDLTLIKLYLFFFKNREIQDVVRTLEIEVYDYYQNNQKNRETIRTTRIMTSSFLFFGWATIANSNINGAIQDYRWRTAVANLGVNDTKPERILAQPIYIPWNYQEDKPYIATFILEAAGLLWTGHIVMIIDTLIGSIILHMSGQFVILQEAFATVYDRTMTQMRVGVNNAEIAEADISLFSDQEINKSEMMNEDESIVRAKYTPQEIKQALDNNLRKCIKQQQLLIRIHTYSCPCFPLLQFGILQTKREKAFFKAGIVGMIESDPHDCHLWLLLFYSVLLNTSCVEKFATTYSYGFLTQLLSSMAAICVIMVQVSKDASTFKSISFATSLAFFFAMIIQLAIQCFTGNELTLQAQAVGQAVWTSKWERVHPEFRRQLVLVMLRAQRPLRLTAAGFANMNNGCFLSIVKAAYSYYAVLSQSQV